MRLTAIEKNVTRFGESKGWIFQKRHSSSSTHTVPTNGLEVVLDKIGQFKPTHKEFIEYTFRDPSGQVVVLVKHDDSGLREIKITNDAMPRKTITELQESLSKVSGRTRVKVSDP
jgi:hypothetical protein